MIQCKICNTCCRSYKKLGKHVIEIHTMSEQDYYDKYSKKETEGICPTCNRDTKFRDIQHGYTKYCNRSCLNKSQIHRDSVSKTKTERYGQPNYNNPQKISEVLQQRTKEDIKNSNLKKKQTTLERYNNPNYNNYEKRIETLIQNGKVLNSKDEADCLYQLCKIFDINDIKYPYKSDDYPYWCDFYIESLDLYIEIHFSWLHGFHRFNENDPEDIAKLNLWKEKALESDYYKKAIKIWTISDIEKYKTAELNHLQYKVFYNKNEFFDWIKTFV